MIVGGRKPTQSWPAPLGLVRLGPSDSDRDRAQEGAAASLLLQRAHARRRTEPRHPKPLADHAAAAVAAFPRPLPQSLNVRERTCWPCFAGRAADTGGGRLAACWPRGCAPPARAGFVGGKCPEGEGGHLSRNGHSERGPVSVRGCLAGHRAACQPRAGTLGVARLVLRRPMRCRAPERPHTPSVALTTEGSR